MGERGEQAQPDEPDEAFADDEDEDELQRQEQAYQRQYDNEHTWDDLHEDEFGNLFVDRTAEQRARRSKLMSAAQSARIRKGMIRYLLLVIDLSRGASIQDLKPNRLGCMLGVCRNFIKEFFDQNPLSQLGLAVMRNGVVEKLTDLSASPEAQIKKLDETKRLGAAGDASLQNALDLGVTMLKSIPPYGHREMLIMFAALSTCDPGNVFESVKAAKDTHIRVSVVGVAAEVYLCRRLADETGGQYGVALSEGHLEQLMLAQSPPPPTSSSYAGAELVRMGFPQRSIDDANAAVFVGPAAVTMAGGYTCPRCKARVLELPCECHTCGLTLISSPHLARSYHHLFPVGPYEELSQDDVAELAAATGDDQLQGPMTHELEIPVYCFGCLRDLNKGGSMNEQQMVLGCPSCKQVFCFECDAYVHESLHNCPGCEFGLGPAAGDGEAGMDGET